MGDPEIIKKSPEWKRPPKGWKLAQGRLRASKHKEADASLQRSLRKRSAVFDELYDLVVEADVPAKAPIPYSFDKSAKRAIWDVQDDLGDVLQLRRRDFDIFTAWWTYREDDARASGDDQRRVAWLTLTEQVGDPRASLSTYAFVLREIRSHHARTGRPCHVVADEAIVERLSVRQSPARINAWIGAEAAETGLTADEIKRNDQGKSANRWDRVKSARQSVILKMRRQRFSHAAIGVEMNRSATAVLYIEEAALRRTANQESARLRTQTPTQDSATTSSSQFRKT
jgi:hypothetical protein